MLYPMRRRPWFAGRRGEGGVRFSFILKRLLPCQYFDQPSPSLPVCIRFTDGADNEERMPDARYR